MSFFVWGVFWSEWSGVCGWFLVVNGLDNQRLTKWNLDSATTIIHSRDEKEGFTSNDIVTKIEVDFFDEGEEVNLPLVPGYDRCPTRFVNMRLAFVGVQNCAIGSNTQCAWKQHKGPCAWVTNLQGKQVDLSRQKMF